MTHMEKYTTTPAGSPFAYILGFIACIISLGMAISNEFPTSAIVVAIFGGSLLVVGAVIGLQKETVEVKRQSLKTEEEEGTKEQEDQEDKVE